MNDPSYSHHTSHNQQQNSHQNSHVDQYQHQDYQDYQQPSNGIEYDQKDQMSLYDCNLSLEDQIYLIFQQNKASSMSVKEIKIFLFQQFKTHVAYYDIKRIRFLSLNSSHSGVRIHIQPDDICPNGYSCKMAQEHCRRIHSSIAVHFCFNLNCNCQLIHLEKQKLTSKILTTILFIYRNRMHSEFNISLPDFLIAGDKFIQTYLQLYKQAPLSNMSHSHWKRLVHVYARYYYDYDQQFQFNLNDNGWRGSKQFWLTKWIKQDNDKWMIQLRVSHWYIARRTCRNHVIHGNCKWHPSFLCPFFHPTLAFIALKNKCKSCHLHKYCSLWHFEEEKLAISYQLPGKAFNRTAIQLTKEIEDKSNNISPIKNIINVYDNDIGNQLDHSRHLQQINYNKSFNKRAGLSIGLIFSPLTSISLHAFNKIDILFNYFSEFGQIIDIEIPAIQKNIILQYKVFKYTVLYHRLCIKLGNKSKLWSFNRTISCNIKALRNSTCSDGVYVIFEFVNVNTFCDVKLMREWFKDILFKFGVMTASEHDNVMRFISGSYHFIKKRVAKSCKYSAIVYTNGIKMSINKLINLNIRGIIIESAEILNKNTKSETIQNQHTKFFDYCDPQIYQILTKQNKLHLHENQEQKHQNIVLNKQNQKQYKQINTNNNIHSNNVSINYNQTQQNTINSNQIQSQQNVCNNNVLNNAHITDNQIRHNVCNNNVSNKQSQQYLIQNNNRNHTTMSDNGSGFDNNQMRQNRSDKNGLNNAHITPNQMQHNVCNNNVTNKQSQQYLNQNNNSNDRTMNNNGVYNDDIDNNQMKHVQNRSNNAINNYNKPIPNNKQTINTSTRNDNKINNSVCTASLRKEYSVYDGMEYSSPSPTPPPYNPNDYEYSDTDSNNINTNNNWNDNKINNNNNIINSNINNANYDNDSVSNYNDQKDYTDGIYDPDDLNEQDNIANINNFDAEKEKIDDKDFYNPIEILQKKHLLYGNILRGKKKQATLLFPDGDARNEICKYCMCELFTKQHEKDCLFIPCWIRDGHSKPHGDIKNAKVWDGMWYNKQ